VRAAMKRHYILNPMRLNYGRQFFEEFAKDEYSKRFTEQENNPRSPFLYCLIYLIVNPDGSMKLDCKFPEDVPLRMRFVHKRPGGAKPGEQLSLDTDVREITNIGIPPYEGKYYFDFVFCLLDATTGRYWLSHLWTKKVCYDLRYYLSSERRSQYRAIGLNLARSYTKTFILGHVNLKTGKFRSSPGIRRLIKHGWIPTISLLPQPYGEMVRIIESTNDITQVDSAAVKMSDEKLLDDILARWLDASLVQKRMDILTAAIDAYRRNDYYCALHILLPQIEGLVTAHVRRKREIPEKNLADRFKQFGDLIKGEAFNSDMTRYLTDVLVQNLTDAFYKTWYPYPKGGKLYQPSNLSPQRHVMLHGEVAPKYFTSGNCLKLISTLDAIILLSLRKSEIAIHRES
jgi:hypothetical protein